MIRSARELFCQRGYHATAFSDIIQHSGAPRGSTYYHFPGGKQELAREAIAAAGAELEQMVEEAAHHADDPASLVRALAEIAAQRLENSDYQSGCAIATMVLELAPRDEELTVELDNVFARWRAALVNRFEPWGIPPEQAAALANLVMSTFEGGLVLSRAARTLEPFKTTIEGLINIIDHHTPRAPASTRRRRRPPLHAEHATG
jgi:TetR/AcrR family transcriptional repressor of lmrAB and yxaGH operons